MEPRVVIPPSVCEGSLIRKVWGPFIDEGVAVRMVSDAPDAWRLETWSPAKGAWVPGGRVDACVTSAPASPEELAALGIAT
jgi:hypothetical protein